MNIQSSQLNIQNLPDITSNIGLLEDGTPRFALLLCRGMLNENGEEKAYYAYLRVSGSQLPLFMQALKERAPLPLAKYGEIVQAGYGHDVPEMVKTMMVERFGAEQEYGAKLEAALLS